MDSEVTYATKVWKGEFIQVLSRHTAADLIIANNLGKTIVDIGEVKDKYYLPELAAVNACTTKYLLWYAGDVNPPPTEWIDEALPLLEDYPIVTCRWDNANVTEKDEGVESVTDFGWTTYLFSDQCYIAKADYMRSIDYDTEHSCKEKYPKHGGNSFERRVAQWLSNQQTPLAVLSDFRYFHIDSRDKTYENGVESR